MQKREEEKIIAGRPKGVHNTELNKLVKGAEKKQSPKEISASPEKRKYYCTSCGDSFDKQQGNFRKSNSLFYKSNNGYINICVRCLNHFEREYTELYHDNDQAIKRLCMAFDWYVNDSVLQSSKKVNSDQSRISAVVSKGQISPHTGKTYDNVLKEQETNAITSMDEYTQLKAEGEINTPQASIERWGIGFSAEDYKALDEHYKMLKRQNPNCDNNQEIFIKDLCYTKIQQIDSMKNKNKESVDAFDKLTKLYRDTFKQAGLKTIAETDASSEECLGVTLAVIGQYTPEEYYKDKNLYKDSDKIGEYNERFVYRPLKNLLTGSNDRDAEFCVEGELD